LISVIIPARNAEKTVERSIRTVLDQEIDELEVLCIINGCTDGTKNVIEKIKDERIKIIESSPGIVPALNAGLRESCGEFIARQDADDAWLTGKLKAQLDYLEKNKDVDILGTQMEIVDINGNHLNYTNYPVENEDIIKNLLSSNNPIGHPSVIFRRRILDKCAGYFDLFPIAEDMDLWARCIPWYKMSNLKEVFVKYTHVHNPKYDPRVPQALSSWYRKIYGV